MSTRMAECGPRARKGQKLCHYFSPRSMVSMPGVDPGWSLSSDLQPCRSKAFKQPRNIGEDVVYRERSPWSPDRAPRSF